MKRCQRGRMWNEGSIHHVYGHRPSHWESEMSGPRRDAVHKDRSWFPYLHPLNLCSPLSLCGDQVYVITDHFLHSTTLSRWIEKHFEKPSLQNPCQCSQWPQFQSPCMDQESLGHVHWGQEVETTHALSALSFPLGANWMQRVLRSPEQQGRLFVQWEDPQRNEQSRHPSPLPPNSSDPHMNVGRGAYSDETLKCLGLFLE